MGMCPGRMIGSRPACHGGATYVLLLLPPLLLLLLHPLGSLRVKLGLQGTAHAPQMRKSDED